jgi:hypothetical protein
VAGQLAAAAESGDLVDIDDFRPLAGRSRSADLADDSGSRRLVEVEPLHQIQQMVRTHLSPPS